MRNHINFKSQPPFPVLYLISLLLFINLFCRLALELSLSTLLPPLHLLFSLLLPPPSLVFYSSLICLVSMCVWSVSVYMHVCSHVYGGQRLMSDVFLDQHPPYIMRQVLSIESRVYWFVAYLVSFGHFMIFAFWMLGLQAGVMSILHFHGYWGIWTQEPNALHSLLDAKDSYFNRWRRGVVRPAVVWISPFLSFSRKR